MGESIGGKGKRAGASTQSTAWPHLHSSSQNPTPLLSARKLGAHFWQLQPPRYSVSNMHPKLNLQRFKDKGFEADVDHRLHQVAPYNSASTPSGSLGFKETIEGSSGYKVKTSMELLKVLKRIWALEDQHVSSVKALKTELDFSLARIQELQFTRHKEQGRFKLFIRSLRDKLQDEEKLRNNSERWRRKLARQLSEAKSCFADALKEVERERKARILLENLCDEFARGVQCLKHNHAVDHGDDPERLTLHISEAWLHERMQMKPAGMNTIVDRLSLDNIQTFLEAKREIGSRKCEEDSNRIDEVNKIAKVRLEGAGKGSKLIPSVYQGRGSSVQRWLSNLTSADFETSNYSQKSPKESIQGKITRSKTRKAQQ